MKHLENASSAGVLPPEYQNLKRPKPNAPLSRSRAVFSLIFGLAEVAFTLGFFLLSARVILDAYETYNRLTGEGVTAKGVVTHLNVDDSDDSNTYRVGYRFSVLRNGDPTNIEGHDYVSHAYYTAREIGQAIEVRYVPADPALNAIQAELAPPSAILPVALALGAALFLSIGLGTLFYAIRTMQHLKRLHTEGRQAEATVFARWQSKDSDGDLTYFVAYAYHAASKPGQRQLVTRSEENSTLYQQYQIGDRLTVRYLPQKPSVCQVVQKIDLA
ncbi:MAG: DUF3592 domain-containing protein [Chloroflexota bacterium]